MPFFRLHNEKRLCTRLVINIKACTWCWHQSKGVCVPIFNVSTFMRKFRVLRSKIKSLFLSQVCTVVFFLLSSSCESSDSSLLGFYRWSDIRSGYCVFFLFCCRQNSPKLNKSLFLWWSIYFELSRWFDFTNDHRRLSSMWPIRKKMAWKWLNKLVSKHSCSRLGEQNKKGGRFF